MTFLHVARWALNFLGEVNLAVKKNWSMSRTRELWVSWNPPKGGIIKINTDGSVNPDGHAAAGGVLRNDKGDWLAGFSMNVDMCSVIAAELWGVKDGLQLAIERGPKDIELEVDSLVVFSLLRDNSNLDHPVSALIRCCQSLMTVANVVEFSHTFREGNRCADLLASLGLDCSPRLHIFDSISSSL
ncbi:Ribonuclease H domain [Dillenia turbinata]|uniref:Ribonuclease H domain n=1 Tax=Dillenia turbinata TaxID=194707 RepID=A0AAN8VR66_9MAGN